jgi:DNA-binding CsgD family transcriptional regulator
VVRLLAASEAYLVGGAPRRALALLDNEAARFADTFDRARADRLIGACRYALGEAVGTPTILMGAAKEFVPYDGALARSTLVMALAAGRVSGRFSSAGETYEDVARLASQIPRMESPDSCAVDALIDANVSLFMRSHAEAVPTYRRAFNLLADQSDDDSTDLLLWLSVGSWGCGALGDFDTLREMAERLVRIARAAPAPEALSQGLMWLGVTELIRGSLVTADVHFTERVQLMSAIGRGSVDVGNMMVLALRGHEEAMRTEADIVERHAVQHSIGWMLVFVEYSIAVFELGRGNYRAAFEAANRDYQDNPFLSMLSFPDLIESASRADEPLTAARALRQLEQRALPSDTPYALGVLARSRALLANDAGHAERLYVESLEQLSRCRAGFQTARTHLVFGEWLRRQKRRLEARSHLRVAYSMFSEMGAEAFAERTRVELDATGEHSRRRVVDTMNELTAQELQIAHLVSVGATNSEVSSQLFISKSTVDYHLGKIYRKLGISYRRQLKTVLSPPIETRTPPSG